MTIGPDTSALRGSALLAIAVNNTRISAGVFRGGSLERQDSIPNGAEGVRAMFETLICEDAGSMAAVLASVAEEPAGVARRAVEGLGLSVLRLGADAPIPIPQALDDASTVGQDRLLTALAAHEMTGQACVVVDAGTAITVDFVDGEGTFQGGAIAPGLGMMLRGLHEWTSALPKLTYEKPDPARGPWGKDTAHAMLVGVTQMARGLVRVVLEDTAEAFGAYPRVIATGGDAETLFEGDEIVETISPELQLHGIRIAVDRLLRAAESEDA